MDQSIIYQKIRANGGRLTRLRREIVQVFFEVNCLMSSADILSRLNRLKLYPNRSTIFRELFFLVRNNIVVRNTISGTDYYEIPESHHHHLVCLNCHLIKKIEFGNHLARQEKKIAQEHQFNIINHSLEFYGYCPSCQK